ncbi:MAG: hypothetical protein DRO67_06445 [Candidatus Asgardarchaeum californiense]|nr:MAG: hypothetical protein DRO67_06445 [Candidatus Asgardarchaeum californiense]
MIKRYCDKCGDEIIDKNKIEKNAFRTTIRTDNSNIALMQIEIIPSKNFVWADSDLCKYCVIDAINKLDDRPKIGSV